MVRAVVRRFDIKVGHCSHCRRCVQGRHRMQTSDALEGRPAYALGSPAPGRVEASSRAAVCEPQRRHDRVDEVTIVQVEPAGRRRVPPRTSGRSLPSTRRRRAVAQRGAHRGLRRHLPVRHHDPLASFVQSGPDRRRGRPRRQREPGPERHHEPRYLRGADRVDPRRPLPEGKTAGPHARADRLHRAPPRAGLAAGDGRGRPPPVRRGGDAPHHRRLDVRGRAGGYVHVFHVEDFAALDQGSPRPAPSASRRRWR